MGVRVTMRAIPPVIRQRSWFLDRVAPGTEHEVSDTRVELEIERLAGLNEAEVGELEVRVDGEGIEPIVERRQIGLLAADEWGGLSDMAQLLAAESPRNARVVKILRDYNAAMGKVGRPYRGARHLWLTMQHPC